MILPQIVNSANPLVSYGATVQKYAAQDASQLAFAKANGPLLSFASTHGALIKFAETHQQVIATATKYATQLSDAQKYAAELKVIQANPALFTQLATYPSTASIPPALLAQAVQAAGGGATGQAILATIAENQSAITNVIAVAPQLTALAPYATQLSQIGANAQFFTQLQADAPQLAALQKAAPELAFLQAHGAAVIQASKDSPSQWQTWYWICVAACLLFILSVPMMRGRWSPSKAKSDELAHEAMVQEEMKKFTSV
jgi:hypothetical protein